MADKLDLAGELSHIDRDFEERSLRCICPDDAKYRKSSSKLADYLSADAEWRACADIQRVFLETRAEFGDVKDWQVQEVVDALPQISPLNMSLIEDSVTRHDQLAVIEEIGRFVSPETKALLHPGTTSYDVLDTARSSLFKKAWHEVIRPQIAEAVGALSELSTKCEGLVQVGRTHLQDTSPVLFEQVLAGYAARLAERVEKCDAAFDDLRGKVSGIVGTGAGIEMVIGRGKSIEYEKAALAKLGLKPDYTSTQVVQKERLADVGHSIVTLMHVLADFGNDIRRMYSSAIREVVSRESQARLGGSSTDAGKDNPINWENVAGTEPLAEGGMRALYFMIQSDFQRDLRSSKTARYQPQLMMAEAYESFARVGKALSKLSVNEDIMKLNLLGVRQMPTEAMTTILRGEGWIHSEYGVGHDFVKKMAVQAKANGTPLIEEAKKDSEFMGLYKDMDPFKRGILDGRIEDYVGSAHERAEINRAYVREILSRK